MQWLTSQPVTLEHAAALWAVRRLIDPDADVRLATNATPALVADGRDVQILGPVTALRPFFRKYAPGECPAARAVTRDVSRAMKTLQAGDDLAAWAPYLAAAQVALVTRPFDQSAVDACFDRHFGSLDQRSQAATWARSIIDHMPVGALLLDAEGLVKLANPAMGKLLRATPIALQGTSAQQLPLEWVDRHGHRVSEFSLLVNTAINHRRAYERVITRTPHDLLLATSVVPIGRKAQGEPVLLVTCMDATDQMLIERGMESEEHRLHYVLNTLPFGVFEFTAEGEIVYANSGLHRMFNYPLGSLLGRPAWFTKPGQVDEGAIRAMYQTMIAERRQPQPYISRVATRHGLPFEVRVDWSYRIDATGEVKGFIATLTDLTEDSLRRTEFSRHIRTQAG